MNDEVDGAQPRRRRSRKSAATSPTRRPPPSTGRRANGASRSSLRLVQRRRAARARGPARAPRPRSPPSAIFTATPIPALEDGRAVQRLGADLADEAGDRGHQRACPSGRARRRGTGRRASPRRPARRARRAGRAARAAPSRANSVAIAATGAARGPGRRSRRPRRPARSTPVAERTARRISRWSGCAGVQVAVEVPARRGRTRRPCRRACPSSCGMIRRGRPAARERLGLDRAGRAGIRRARLGQPAARRRRRTARTCTGSPLCEAHITATSSSRERLGDPPERHGRLQRLHRRAREDQAVRDRRRRRARGRRRRRRPRGRGGRYSSRPERTTRTSGTAVGTWRSLA